MPIRAMLDLTTPLELNLDRVLVIDLKLKLRPVNIRPIVINEPTTFSESISDIVFKDADKIPIAAAIPTNEATFIPEVKASNES